MPDGGPMTSWDILLLVLIALAIVAGIVVVFRKRKVIVGAAPSKKDLERRKEEARVYAAKMEKFLEQEAIGNRVLGKIKSRVREIDPSIRVWPLRPIHPDYPFVIQVSRDPDDASPMGESLSDVVINLFQQVGRPFTHVFRGSRVPYHLYQESELIEEVIKEVEGRTLPPLPPAA